MMSATINSTFIIDDDFTLNVLEEPEEPVTLNIWEGEEPPKNDKKKEEKKGEQVNKTLNNKGYRCVRCSTKDKNSCSGNCIDCESYKLRCKSCAFVASNKGTLSMHMARCNYAHKVYCTEKNCNYVTIKPKLLRNHIKHVHLGERVFRCRICDFRAENREAYTLHRQEVHAIDKPHQCEYCNFQCARKDRLRKHVEKEHIQSKHVKIKKMTIHKCDLCDYESQYKVNVIRHRSLHLTQDNVSSVS